MSYSGEQTRASKTNFYAAFLLMPREKREALNAVYAFCRHSDDIVDEEPDKVKAEAELDAWRRELDDCFAGRPGHPIMRDLAEHGLASFPLPRVHFDEILDGCEMDLNTSRYATFTDLERYCHRVASAVGLLCIEIFGYEDPRTRDYARELGLALQLTNILRDVASDATIGRIYLPLDELERFGVTERELLEQRPGERFPALMAHGVERASEVYARSRALGEKIWTPNLFPAEIMGQIYHRILRRIPEMEYDVFRERPRVSNPVKLWVAFSIYVRTVILGKRPWTSVASL